jgi:RNA polymerase sigma-70 factor, ECF subfamily
MVVTVSSFDEVGLARAARSGDELAFDALVGPLIDPAFKLAVVFLRDPVEAEDAVQEACLKAWKKLDQLHPGAPLRPWFLSIVANHCRSVRRARWWSEIRMASFPDRPNSIAENIESNLDLDRELAKLSVTDRAALFLFFNLDLPMNEIGRVLRISPQAAKSRVHRAVVKLRLSLAEEES